MMKKCDCPIVERPQKTPTWKRGVFVCTYTCTYTNTQRDTIQGTAPHCPHSARWRTTPLTTAAKYSIRPTTYPRKPTTESRMLSAQFHTVTCRPRPRTHPSKPTTSLGCWVARVPVDPFRLPKKKKVKKKERMWSFTNKSLALALSIHNKHKHMWVV